MRILFWILVLTGSLFAQVRTEGTVTFISSRNVYIKYDNTGGINIGDTLFVKKGKTTLPALIVKYKSSTSVAAEPFAGMEFVTGDKIIALADEITKTDDTAPPPVAAEKEQEKEISARTMPKAEKDRVNGRISVASYSMTGNNYTGSQRWKYRVSLSADNIADKNIDFEMYTNYSYRTSEWGRIKDNPFDELRVYSFNFKYGGENYSVAAGRKYNRNVSNLGAFDGIEAEYYSGNNTFGFIAGSRPGLNNYGLDMKLFEAGVFYSREDSLESGPMKNSAGIFHQTNDFKTDRRFIYLQHSAYYLPGLYGFFSGEADLYKREAGAGKNTLRLTGIYSSLRYRLNRFSASFSYDARNNVILYETYKTRTDSLLEFELRQGARVRLNYRFGNLAVGVNAGYRSRPSDTKGSSNYGATVSYSGIPVLDISAAGGYTRLVTSYLDGDIFNLGINKYFTGIRASLSAGYRKIFFYYTLSGFKLKQDIVSANISYRFAGAFILNLGYEGVFEGKNLVNRFYNNLTYRF